MSVTDHLQEMADIAQDQGMHPDNINAVCDSYSELLAEREQGYHSRAEVIAHVAAERDKYKAQRDELLAALKAFAKWETTTMDDDELREVFMACHAAIAKATASAEEEGRAQ